MAWSSSLMACSILPAARCSPISASAAANSWRTTRSFSPAAIRSWSSARRSVISGESAPAPPACPDRSRAAGDAAGTRADSCIAQAPYVLSGRARHAARVRSDAVPHHPGTGLAPGARTLLSRDYAARRYLSRRAPSPRRLRPPGTFGTLGPRGGRVARGSLAGADAAAGNLGGREPDAGAVVAAGPRADSERCGFRELVPGGHDGGHAADQNAPALAQGVV